MKQLNISANEAGQRLDKLLAKYLREAPKSFLYKMMRKKNITLNGKKVQGNEILKVGDEVKLFFSDETLEKFRGQNVSAKIRPTRQKLDILYEDENIILINKPAGMLSQKAKPQDVSLVEHLISYLIESNSLTQEQLQSFHPSVCNRLDRNTSGLVVAGKSLVGLQQMSQMLQERSMQKYYCCIVAGTMQGSCHLKGYLVKNQKTNTVTVSEQADETDPECKRIETSYRVLAAGNGLTMLEVHLITGRSHQIRAHLASIGHPILGDPKYGDEKLNRRYRASHQISGQLLHACRLEMPKQMTGTLAYLAGECFTAPIPSLYHRLLNEH